MLVHSAANHSSVWTEATDIFATALLFFYFQILVPFFILLYLGSHCLGPTVLHFLLDLALTSSC